jgi:hypothetical protein
MELPFTAEQFFGVFRAYNTTLWPVQMFLLVLAGLAVVLVMWPRSWSGVGVSAILALLWGWMGLAYHLAFFTAISPPAYAFAAVFVAGALVFLWQGVVRRRLEFRWQAGVRGVTALLLVVYALVVYPAWSHFAGQPYLETPTFGLPCPTTIFTMGLLACLVKPYRRSVFVVPVLWSLVGVQAAFLLSVPQDLGLAVVAVVGLVLISRPRLTAASSPVPSPEAAGAVP